MSQPATPPSRTDAAATASPGWHRVFIDGVPNVIVFGLLAVVFFVGHRTGWKVPHDWSLSATSTSPVDDWCPEHLVPESVCVECNDKLLPKPHEFGFCKTHGVAECVIDHPELAQVARTPHLPRYDTAQALALMTRPENDPKDTLHSRRVQLATEETAQKAGINVDVVSERPMTDAVVANGEVTFDPARVAHLSSRLQGTVA
jgi:cobalt-zinc-cadmium efflux system membrane fusion protein